MDNLDVLLLIIFCLLCYFLVACLNDVDAGEQIPQTLQARAAAPRPVAVTPAPPPAARLVRALQRAVTHRPARRRSSHHVARPRRAGA